MADQSDLDALFPDTLGAFAMGVLMEKKEVFSLLLLWGWGSWQDGALQKPGSLPFPSEPFPELRNPQEISLQPLCSRKRDHF